MTKISIIFEVCSTVRGWLEFYEFVLLLQNRETKDGDGFLTKTKNSLTYFPYLWTR